MDACSMCSYFHLIEIETDCKLHRCIYLYESAC